MRIKKFLLFILSLSLVGGFSTGCKDKADEVAEFMDEPVKVSDLVSDEYGISIDEDSVTFVDGRGEEVRIGKKPERAIVLFASFVDIWMRNGGDMVGMVEPSNEYYMPGTEHIETLGKQGSISLEKVISLEPDLVVLSYNTGSHLDLIPALEENHIPVMALDYQFKEDYFKISKVFATINDRMELYEKDAQMVKEETEKIMSRVPKNKESKVLIIMATKNAIGAINSDTTIGEMFKDLGAINIADGSNEKLSEKNFSLEKILEEDPDFIFVQAMGSDMEAIEERIRNDAQSNPAWSSLKAIRNGNYIVLDKDLYTYKANHRYAEAYENLAKILYPEVFN
ncbi:MAG: ABC transporter substrate-binding protein [Tissierellaceae bacterium]